MMLMDAAAEVSSAKRFAFFSAMLKRTVAGGQLGWKGDAAREGDATFDLICGMQVSAYTTGETVQEGGS